MASTAVASFLGYYNQVLFALPELLGATDDDATIALELVDDVDLQGAQGAIVFQLKTSLTEGPAQLTIASEGLWKSLRNWLEGDSSINAVQYQLVTRATIADTSSLQVLSVPVERRESSSRDALLADLRTEARRIVNDVEEERLSSKDKRLSGCKAALASESKLEALVDRMVIRDGHRAVEDFWTEVYPRLSLVPDDYREELSRRLVEWWSLRVLESMLGNKPRRIQKREVLDFCAARTSELHTRRNLPDSFAERKPALGTELEVPLLRKQIELVKGGVNRTELAALAWWRAREQRQEWLEGGFFVDLERFDQGLRDAWQDRFGPLSDDCVGVDEPQKAMKGRDLLDWTRLQAPSEVPRVADTWQSPYLVQGSYQELADKLTVGWHPDYLQRLRGDGEKEEDP